MLTTASQLTPRARPLSTRHAAAVRALAAAGIRHRQQTRSFRFGFWSNCLDDDFHREIRRRQRMLKHRYAEQINRQLSWDQHPFAEDARRALKRMMNSYWHSHDARPRGRSRDEIIKPSKEWTPENKDGVRPGRNIEDVERGAMDHLMFGEDDTYTSSHQPAWRTRREGRKAKPVYHTSYGQPIEQDDFVIDPITNRKVAKHPVPSDAEDGVDIPVKTFKDYRSQFVHPDVISKPTKPQDHFEDAPSAEELRNSGQGGIGTKPENTNATVSGSGSGDPILGSEEHVRSHASVESKYSELEDSRLWQDGSSASAPKYDDLHEYKPLLDNETVHEAEDKLKYDDLHKYRPVQYLVPDGKPDATVEERSKQYTDLHRYKAAVDDAHVQFDDLKPPYEDLDQYGYRLRVAEEIARRFEDGETSDAKQNQPTTDEIASTKEDVESAYDDFHPYQAISHNEPDGKPLGFKEESVKPEVLQKYQSFIERLEPGDFPESTVEDLRKKYGQAELKQYTAVRYLDPDRHPGLTAEEPIKLDEDLGKYSPVTRSEPHDLHIYDGPVLFNEPDGQLPPSEEELSLEKRRGEAHRYQEPILWNEPDGKPSPTEEEISLLNRRIGLHQYGPFKNQEPDGHPTAQAESSHDGLEHVDAQRDSGNPERIAPQELDNADESSPEVLRKLYQGIAAQGEKSDYREMLDSLMKRHDRLSDAVDREATLAVKSARAKTQQSGSSERNLTGNYVRDFPEEFEKSWTQTLSSAPGETAETSYQNESQTEGENMDGGLEGAFGRPAPSKIQPALDRHSTRKAGIDHADSCSKEPRDLQSSYTEQCSGPSQPLLVKQYGETSEAEETNKATAEESSSAAPEKASEAFEETTSVLDDGPTLYKILAYDPVTQKVNMAETTSLNPDFTSALSPADALIRLSHPVQFFPHFASLEDEGFELVSGSGDVLIFRKARSNTKQGESTEDSQADSMSTTAEPEPSEGPVNPIDMTGRPKMMSPASANFASPTGYVTYENLPENEASNLPPPPPRVKYNIDLRREEPVFSGPKFRAGGGQKQKKSLGKRLLVGGVWVAGISYGLGVVSEYFTTGGIDGMGPTGF